MAEKHESCPDCHKPLRGAGYDLQHCPCGWDALEGLRGDVYQGTIARLEENIAMIDQGAALASIAISLKRIADATEQIAGWLNGDGVNLTIDRLSGTIHDSIYNAIVGGHRR
jgi:hypothetical protein